MANKKVRRKYERKNPSLKENIQSEVIGIFIVGMACLGFVALYSDRSGVVGADIRFALTALAGGGRAWLLVLIGLWGLTFMSKHTRRPGWRAVGVMLLWLVMLGLMHFQLPGIQAFSQQDMFREGKLGHGGGLIGAVIALALRTAVGVQGGYVLLGMGALIGALLVVNRSLVGGLREAWRLGKEAGHWLKNQVGDFIYVVQNPEEDDVPYESAEVKINTGSKVLSKVFNKKKGIGAEKSVVLDPDIVERPLIIRTFADNVSEPEFNREQNVGYDRQVGRHAEPERYADTSGYSADDSYVKGKLAGTQQTPQVGILPPGRLTGTPVSRQVYPDSNYELPPLTLLHKSLRVKNSRLNKDLADNVRILEETLDSFGVKVKVTHVTQGPAITRYEAQPAPGIKVSKITNLADDIALSLAAQDVRIEAPIPGKSVVGIEVPNREIATVHFREVMDAPEFQSASSKLSLCLGKDITGTPVVADLTKMPHLLIAGATGSGKSVCVNTLIHSILFKARPDEVKFLLVDPKMVELTTYNGIPHLIAPVVTDPKKAAGALKWIVTEMETRYELFAAAGVRDVVRYNFLRSQEKQSEHPPLPYVVVIIDELADLMMVAPGDVEDAICRLAQMARAAGIHLIVATQRPSVDVITGLIKANIPSRIAFAVSSQIDSRTILDMNGAERLLGRGDMLFYPMGASKPVRVQGCFLADKEVENVVKFLQEQAKPEYQDIPNIEVGSNKVEEAEDELFYQAAQLFIESGNASVSLLQRRLRIGYTRAARLMDMLEDKGVVGGYEGSKPREVLLTRGQFEQKFGPWPDANAN
ncbi:DNA translocase FtsK [Paradesulfitobacterium aromaticivorans]